MNESNSQKYNIFAKYERCSRKKSLNGPNNRPALLAYCTTTFLV